MRPKRTNVIPTPRPRKPGITFLPQRAALSWERSVSCGKRTSTWRTRAKLGAEKIEKIVIGAAQRVGLKKENPSIADAIRFLEKTFPFVGDKLTPAFGGGLQHHLRDFSHHPSPVGIVCSILMQFTGKGFGTRRMGAS